MADNYDELGTDFGGSEKERAVAKQVSENAELVSGDDYWESEDPNDELVDGTDYEDDAKVNKDANTAPKNPKCPDSAKRKKETQLKDVRTATPFEYDGAISQERAQEAQEWLSSRKNSNVNVGLLDADFGVKVADMGKAWEKATGETFNLTSGFRPPTSIMSDSMGLSGSGVSIQSRLNTGSNYVASSLGSGHGIGQAVDIGNWKRSGMWNTPRGRLADSLAGQYGLQRRLRPGKARYLEPWHVETADIKPGGVAANFGTGSSTSSQLAAAKKMFEGSNLQNVAAGKQVGKFKEVTGKKWEEQLDECGKPIYPNVQTDQTPNGSKTVRDSTPGHGVNLDYHGPSGGYTQTDNDGNRQSKVNGDELAVVFGDKTELVTGTYNLTVGGDFGLLVKGSITIKSGGTTVVVSDGDVLISSAANVHLNKTKPDGKIHEMKMWDQPNLRKPGPNPEGAPKSLANPDGSLKTDKQLADELGEKVGTTQPVSTGVPGIDPNLTGLDAAEAEARRLMIKHNMTPEAAAGLTGNLMAESSMDPTALGDGGHASGWAQWNGVRQREFKNWAASNNLDYRSVAANQGFLDRDLYGNHWTQGGSIKQMAQLTNVDQSARYFMEKYERPGIPNWSHRQQYSNAIYRRLVN